MDESELQLTTEQGKMKFIFPLCCFQMSPAEAVKGILLFDLLLYSLLILLSIPREITLVFVPFLVITAISFRKRKNITKHWSRPWVLGSRAVFWLISFFTAVIFLVMSVIDQLENGEYYDEGHHRHKHIFFSFMKLCMCVFQGTICKNLKRAFELLDIETPQAEVHAVIGAPIQMVVMPSTAVHTPNPMVYQPFADPAFSQPKPYAPAGPAAPAN